MPRHFIGHQSFKDRGASSNLAGRFEALIVEKADDGWYQDEIVESPSETVLPDRARSVITSNDSPDVGFEVSINPYRGCAHGCVYCFARPSHAYLGLSPGLDFETKIVFKPEAPRLLEKELSRASYKPGVIVLGSNTDPYQPVERTLALTRGILDVLERFNNPVAIITKSAGVLRDADILARMAAKNLAKVHISLTTLDPALARVMEPRAASPSRRLAAIGELAVQNIPVGVMAAPMILGLNDAELETILEAAAKAGAQSAHLSLLRLPHELGPLFTDWLEKYLPERASHVLSLVRQSRAGQLNDPRFFARFAGSGPHVDMLHQRFDRAIRKFFLKHKGTSLDCSHFAVPRATPAAAQMSLF